MHCELYMYRFLIILYANVDNNICIHLYYRRKMELQFEISGIINVSQLLQVFHEILQNKEY